MNKMALMIIVLTALNVCSAVAVVFTKHLSRERYSEISRHQQMIDELDVQWSQLQIEESTFSEHGLVERTARDRLGMELPEQRDTVMIARQP